MKDSRIGESLWLEWTGDDNGQFGSSEAVMYTEEHVDIDNEVVRRALASALQRDGIAISLGEGYKYVDSAELSFGYAGRVDDSFDLIECSEYGETRDGDIVDEIMKITWVEIGCQKA
jgi:ABC-type transport system substrate-binding protein